MCQVLLGDLEDINYVFTAFGQCTLAIPWPNFGQNNVETEQHRILVISNKAENILQGK